MNWRVFTFPFLRLVINISLVLYCDGKFDDWKMLMLTLVWVGFLVVRFEVGGEGG